MKRIIIAYDGTWNQLQPELGTDETTPQPTNVVLAVKEILPIDQPDPVNQVAQILFYDQGVGTGEGRLPTVDKVTGGAFGSGLFKNVEDGYRFLSANFDDGDEIFVFGFSRGAFTARSLVGLIGLCGIPVRNAINLTLDAQILYREQRDLAPEVLSERLNQIHKRLGRSKDVNTIKFLGCWDTVESLGLPKAIPIVSTIYNEKFKFHNYFIGDHVKAAAHAVALDEKRNVFDVTLMNEKTRNGTPDPRITQVWFPGTHGDVGGGRKVSGLSNAAFIWMMEHAATQGLALRPNFKSSYDLNPLAPIKPTKRTWKQYFWRTLYGLAGTEDRLPRPDPSGTGAYPLSRNHLHESAIQRFNSDLKYRPSYLKKVLQ